MILIKMFYAYQHQKAVSKKGNNEKLMFKGKDNKKRLSQKLMKQSFIYMLFINLLIVIT